MTVSIICGWQSILEKIDFKTHVIGHLSKEDARLYWEQHALPQYRRDDNPSFKPPVFEDVFAVCGGSIMLLDRYCEQYNDHGSVLAGKFSFVQLAMANLVSNGLLESQTKWTKKQFLSVMTSLTKDGFIIYDDLCQEMTKEVAKPTFVLNLRH